MSQTLARALIYVGGGILILLLVRLFAAPIRWGLKLLANTALGFLALLAFNFFGKYIGVTLGLNLINAVIIALLGPAGLVVLLLARWLTIG